MEERIKFLEEKLNIPEKASESDIKFVMMCPICFRENKSCIVRIKAISNCLTKKRKYNIACICSNNHTFDNISVKLIDKNEIFLQRDNEYKDGNYYSVPD
uniref:Uncharacterized protein n=1 Tax=viral metagenome TaxID=1070528 RepID=A0A6C0AF72_9ZZZZ